MPPLLLSRRRRSSRQLQPRPHVRVLNTKLLCHGPQMRATQVTVIQLCRIIAVELSTAARISTGWPAFAGHDNQNKTTEGSALPALDMPRRDGAGALMRAVRAVHVGRPMIACMRQQRETPTRQRK